MNINNISLVNAELEAENRIIDRILRRLPQAYSGSLGIDRRDSMERMDHMDRIDCMERMNLMERMDCLERMEQMERMDISRRGNGMMAGVGGGGGDEGRESLYSKTRTGLNPSYLPNMIHGDDFRKAAKMYKSSG